jgi:hypothetical protein
MQGQLADVFVDDVGSSVNCYDLQQLPSRTCICICNSSSAAGGSGELFKVWVMIKVMHMRVSTHAGTSAYMYMYLPVLCLSSVACVNCPIMACTLRHATSSELAIRPCMLSALITPYADMLLHVPVT